MDQRLVAKQVVRSNVAKRSQLFRSSDFVPTHSEPSTPTDGAISRAARAFKNKHACAWQDVFYGPGHLLSYAQTTSASVGQRCVQRFAEARVGLDRLRSSCGVRT